MKIESSTRQGFASLIVLLLLAMMVGIVMANSGALFHLRREVKNVERRQELRSQRLNAGATNIPSVEVKR